ncbi:MAG: hypothetical protein V3V13_01335 [Paracoccaceae bacterium]
MSDKDDQDDKETVADEGAVLRDDDASEPEYHEQDSEHATGLATRVLTGLALIALGGGIALWAAPKIAPNLPVGMAPVAMWLSPGIARVDTEFARLRTDMDARFAALPDITQPPDISQALADSTATLRTDLSARIDAVSDQVQAIDITDIESRIVALEMKTDGLRSEVSTLTKQLGAVTISGGEVNAQTAAQIMTYAATLDGFKAELENLATQNSTLAREIDTIAAQTERQVTAAEDKVLQVTETAEMTRNSAIIKTNMSALAAALSSGAAFAKNLDALQTVQMDMEIPAALSDHQNGIAGMQDLRNDFPDAAHSAIRAANSPAPNDGMLARVGSFLRTQVASRSLTPQEGNSVDAILSRAEAALKQGDLSTALLEIDTLPASATPPDSPMLNWILMAHARHDALIAYDALTRALEPQ